MGNSNGIIIPAAILRAYGLQRGDVVEFDLTYKAYLSIYKSINKK